MLAHQRLQTCSPIKKLFHKLGNSYQTYINFHKTHTMATCYSGIGDTSMNDPESQDIVIVRKIIRESYHIEFDSPVELKHLTYKMEQLRQTLEEKDNDPRDT